MDDATLTILFDDIQNIIENLSPSFNNLANSDNPQIEDILALTLRLYQAIEGLAQSSFFRVVVGTDDKLILEIFYFLSYRYLATRIFLVESALSALGIITHELKETTELGGRQVDFVRTKFQWSRLADLFQDNAKWAYDVYGWAGNPHNGDAKHFDFVKAIRNSIGFIHASGLSLAYLREISNSSEIDFFLKNVGEEQVFEAFLPFYQSDLISFDNETNQSIFSSEAGVKFVPFGDLTKPKTLGLAVAPYIKGDVPNKQQLSERLTFDIFVSGQATGGAYLTITPDGIEVVGGGAINAEFDFSMTYENPDQSPILLVGDSQSTHIQTDTILGVVGGNMDGDFYLRAGFNNLKVVVDISEDGFLNALLSTPIEIDVGDVILEWRTGRGVHFEGGTSLGLNVPLNLNLSTISIISIQIKIEATDEQLALMTGATGEVKFGPVTAIVYEFGLKPLLEFEKQGNLGNSNFSIGFKPPTSIGLSINAVGVTGGGFLRIDPPNYAGVMELSFQNEIDLAAFGLITTQLPDGKPGFSLVIQILAEFQPVQLELGFALTGVGGLIGINRHINETNLRDAIKNHTFDLFPQNPITDAVRLLGTIESVLPAKEGFHVFGPMVKIFWGGSVKLVEFEVGVFIEIGGPTRVALIGRAWSKLPSEETQLLVLNVDVFGIIDFGDERIALDAFLFDSKILRFPFDGQMALRADWSEGEANFALSVGGFHPRFQAIPPGFPTLRWLMVSVGSGNPRLTLMMYLAITTNTLQIGAKLDLWAKKAGFTITGGAGFDALIVFSPFSFLVILNIWVNVKKWGIELGVSLELELSGPNPFIAVGFAKFKVGWFTKRVRFRKEFGDRIDEPLPVVSPLAVLKAELENPRSIRFKLPDWASANLIFTQAAESRIDPVAEIIIDQDAVPLDLTMDRFGGGTPLPAEKKLNITAGLRVDEEHPTTSLFAPNQFKNWTEKQRLSAKPFEKFKSGIRMSGNWVIPEDDIEERCIGFETVVRESKDYRATFPAHVIEAALDRFICVWQPQEASLMENWSMFGSGNYFRPLRKTADKTNPNYIRVVEPAFTVVSDEVINGQSERLDVVGAVTSDMTYAEALEFAEQFKGSSVNVRNVVEVESVVL